MSQDFELQIELTAQKSAVEALAEDVRAAGNEQVEILDIRPERDETKQAFGVTELATVVLIVKGVYYTGKLAEVVLARIRSTQSRISIRTPYSSVEIAYDGGLTEDQVRELMKKAADL